MMLFHLHFESPRGRHLKLTVYILHPYGRLFKIRRCGFRLPRSHIGSFCDLNVTFPERGPEHHFPWMLGGRVIQDENSISERKEIRQISETSFVPPTNIGRWYMMASLAPAFPNPRYGQLGRG
jgi:hypothetical protein